MSSTAMSLGVTCQLGSNDLIVGMVISHDRKRHEAEATSRRQHDVILLVGLEV